MDRVGLTGVERTFHADEIIVSKTDPKGRITYCNDVFLRISGYGEAELIGKPHSIIRHPDMPRCVFKLLWDSLTEGRELFAYVVNRCKNGDHYWVLAHATPDYDAQGQLLGYHSNRRTPEPAALAAIKPLYAELLDIEAKAADRKIGLEQSFARLTSILADKGVDYDRFVLDL